MSDKDKDEPEEEPQETEETEEQEQETEETEYKHTCGAELQEGMKYCPACGEEVDTSAYK